MAQPQEAQANARPHRIGRLATALVAGLVGGLLAPLVYPSLARGARPTAKRALKAGIAAFERGRVAAAELGEHASDLYAEAHAEYADEQRPSPRPDEAASAPEVVALRGPAREAAGP
jgi:hypothetical protein